MIERFWAVIPGGGHGRRFESPIPKQYSNLAGSAVLDHVLECFLKMNEFEAVVVAIHKEDQRFTGLHHAHDSRVFAVTGGLERADSVLAGLQWLNANGADHNDWVFVHDAARPLVSESELSALMSALEQPECPGVVLAVPVADTLKLVNKVDARAEIPITCVGETLDRSQLWHAMTPQVFRLGALRSALTVASDRGFAVTDDSQAMESVGVFPWLVRGRRSNIKLTYSEDSELIEAILLARRTAVV